MFLRPTYVCCILAMILMLCQAPALCAQAGRPGRSSASTEIKWDVYTFKFLPGNQMAQVLDADGHVIATILAQGGGLQILPTISGDAAEKLKKSFQAWKDQGGEKALNGGSSPVPGASRGGTSPAAQPASSSSASPSPAAPSSAAPAASTGSGPSTSAPATSAAAASPAPGTNTSLHSEPGHGILNAEELARFGNGTVPFDLVSMRFHPELLAQKPVMQYFIALNNCHDSSVERALQNELDYPALANFYSAKAQEILAGLPDVAGVLMFRGYQGGWLLWGHPARGGRDPSAQEKLTLSLGEYDVSRKAFPILTSDKIEGFEVSGTQVGENDRVSLQKSCPVGYNTFMRSHLINVMPTGYAVTVASPMNFSELPMGEADARKFIEGASAGAAQRNILVGVEMHLKPDAQRSTAKQFI